MIGRDTEIGLLRTGFDRAMHGHGRGMLVAGAIRVETALINELRPIVTAAGGWFVSGKSDQYRVDTASGGVSQALRALGRMLLAEPSAQLAAQRTRILAALGANAGVMNSTVPELAVLLGDVPPPAPEGAIRSRPRRGSSRPAGPRRVRHPASPARLSTGARRPAMGDLGGDWSGRWPADGWREPNGLLLVGAYREAEVDPAHPLSAMLSRWARMASPPPTVRLRNLPEADLGALLAQVVIALAEAADLAEAVAALVWRQPVRHRGAGQRPSARRRAGAG